MDFVNSTYEEALDLLNAERYPEAIEKLELAERLESTEAMLTLGDLFFQGKGMESPDYTIARGYYERAALMYHNHLAYFHLGTCYLWGLGGLKNISEAFKCFNIAAKEGSPSAFYMLGYMYEHGIYIPKDIQKSIENYQIATQRHHILANVELGNIYHNGIGVEKDDRRAFLYYQYAAALGNQAAKKELAYFYENGIYVHRDRTKAIKLYRDLYEENEKRFQKNDPNAALNLGFIYFEGLRLINIEQNFDKAFSYFEKAAKQKIPSAQNMMGVCYQMGLGVNSNINEAVKFFRMASDSGLACAKGNLAECYFDGLDQESVDLNTAKEMLVEAADWGYPPSQILLGKYYMEGKNGFDNNKDKGLQYLIAAKESGVKDAFAPLAKYYLENDFSLFGGCNDDALLLLNEGAELGDLASKVLLAECLINSEGIDHNPNMALEILLSVIDEREINETLHNSAVLYGDDQGMMTYIINPLNKDRQTYYAKAYYLLATLYYSGKGVEKKDPNEAIHLLNVAENLGNEEALNLKVKILEEVSSNEINKLKMRIKLYNHSWEAGKTQKTGKYNLILVRPDGSELPPLWFKTVDAKFLYLILLYSLRYKTPIKKQLFDYKSIELSDLARFLDIELKYVDRYIDWIEGFDYSGESSRIDKSFEDKKKNGILTIDEIKICQVVSKGQGKNKSWLKTLKFSKDQIIYPESNEIDSYFDKIFSKVNNFE